MSITPPPETDRRRALALTAAVASTTLAIAVTAGSLLGWIRPPGASAPRPANPGFPDGPAETAPAPAPAEPDVAPPPAAQVAAEAPEAPEVPEARRWAPRHHEDREHGEDRRGEHGEDHDD